jgi:hypothetical protein
MSERKSQRTPILRIKKGDTRKAIYAKARRSFTAADLQKFTVIDQGIPAEQMLAELEALDRQASRKPNRKPKDDRTR